eukprot:922419-Amphidinium_carterae.1
MRGTLASHWHHPWRLKCLRSASLCSPSWHLPLWQQHPWLVPGGTRGTQREHSWLPLHSPKLPKRS